MDNRTTKPSVRFWLPGAMTVVLVATIVAVVFAVKGAGRVTEPIVDRDTAVGVLRDVVGAATESQDKVCDYAGSVPNCQREVQFARDADISPVGDPQIICDGPVDAGKGHIGGYGLVVTGSTSDGGTYRTEILAFATSDGIKLVNPVFWTGVELALDSSDASKTWVCKT